MKKNILPSLSKAIHICEKGFNQPRFFFVKQNDMIGQNVYRCQNKFKRKVFQTKVVS
jgi:hypothetical protein